MSIQFQWLQAIRCSDGTETVSVGRILASPPAGLQISMKVIEGENLNLDFGGPHAYAASQKQPQDGCATSEQRFK